MLFSPAYALAGVNPVSEYDLRNGNCTTYGNNYSNVKNNRSSIENQTTGGNSGSSNHSNSGQTNSKYIDSILVIPSKGSSSNKHKNAVNNKIHPLCSIQFFTPNFLIVNIEKEFETSSGRFVIVDNQGRPLEVNSNNNCGRSKK